MEELKPLNNNNNEASGGAQPAPPKPQPSRMAQIIVGLFLYVCFLFVIVIGNSMYKAKISKDMEKLRQDALKANATQIAAEEREEREQRRREAFSLSIIREDEKGDSSADLFRQAVEAEKAKNNPYSNQQQIAPTPGQQYEHYQAQIQAQEEAARREEARRAQAEEAAFKRAEEQERRREAAEAAQRQRAQASAARTAAPAKGKMQPKQQPSPAPKKQEDTGTRVNKLETKKIF